MNKLDFQSLFQHVIEDAILEVECSLNITTSRNIEVELHGAGYSRFITTLPQSIDILFLSEETFYKIIDIAVIAVSKTKTRIFVRISNHAPDSFESTWNTPPGNGPFKVLVAQKVEIFSDV